MIQPERSFHARERVVGRRSSGRGEGLEGLFALTGHASPLTRLSLRDAVKRREEAEMKRWYSWAIASFVLVVPAVAYAGPKVMAALGCCPFCP
jgi:hypothetical protein